MANPIRRRCPGVPPLIFRSSRPVRRQNRSLCRSGNMAQRTEPFPVSRLPASPPLPTGHRSATAQQPSSLHPPWHRLHTCLTTPASSVTETPCSLFWAALSKPVAHHFNRIPSPRQTAKHAPPHTHTHARAPNSLISRQRTPPRRPQEDLLTCSRVAQQSPSERSSISPSPSPFSLLPPSLPPATQSAQHG